MTTSPDHAPRQPAVTQESMDALGQCASPWAQWQCIDRMQSPADPNLTAGYCQAMFDFAANPESSSSLVVRASAFENGISALKYAVSREYPLTPDLYAKHAYLTELIPNYFNDEAVQSAAFVCRSYVWAFNQLARTEELLHDFLFPDPFSLDYGVFHVPDNIPVAAGMLMDTIVSSEDVTMLQYLPSELFGDTLDAALTPPERIDAKKAAKINEYAKLARLTKEGGFEHDTPIEYLYNIPGEKGLEYVQTLNKLYDAAADLRSIFPSELAEDVVHGARKLVANTLFAVAHHLENNETTNERLTLLGGTDVIISYQGDEPLRLLQRLESILKRTTYRFAEDDRTRVSLVAREKNFSLYAFESDKPELPSDPIRVMQYIRPAGGPDCNRPYEYGGRRHGVQASIDFRVDEGAPLIPTRPYYKQSLSLNSLSIRLDREGRHPDEAVPINQQDSGGDIGTISLDIGSIKERGLGGDIGRLLALGNVLRSQAIKAPRTLNHVTESFDQQYGQAAAFSELAAGQARYLDRRIQDQASRSCVSEAIASLAVRTN